MHKLIVFTLLAFCFSCKNETKMNHPAPANSDKQNYLRVGTFNIAIGQFATPGEIAARLKPLDLDILSLTECPVAIDKQTTPAFADLLSKALGMEYVATGSISSGDHWQEWGVDTTGKYHGKLRAILSKTPLTAVNETLLSGKGWKNASVLNATTHVCGRQFSIYTLHIPGCKGDITGSVMKDLVDRVLNNETNKNALVMGDFNDLPESPAMQYIFDSGYKSVWSDIANPEKNRDVYAHGIIDNILLKKASGLSAVDVYSIYPASGKLSDHPYVWCKLLIP